LLNKEKAMSKGEKTRERIVSKAAQLFNERGLEGTSLADLMKATGLEKGGIYRHFPSKEAVAVEAFDYAWHSAFAARMHDLDAISNSVDKLKQFMRNFVERRPSISGGCPLLNTAIDADDGNPALRERARKALREWRNLLSEIVNTGIERREIRRGVNVRQLATLIISSLEGAFVISRLERDREALMATHAYLEHYLETEVRLGK
jgi:TetR/AcrR family transcriptional repressor of nem operon